MSAIDAMRRRSQMKVRLATSLLATCMGAALASGALWIALDAAPSPKYVASAFVADLSAATVLGLLAFLSRTELARQLAVGAWVGIAFLESGVATPISASILAAAACSVLGPQGGLAGGVVGASTAFARIAGPTVLDHFAPQAPLPEFIAFAGFLTSALSLALVVKRWRAVSIVALALPLALVSLGLGWYRGRNEHPVGRPTATPAEGAPHLIVLVLDTVSAGHLRAYGGARDTMPELERWVAAHPRASVAPWAFSTDSWTLPAHASLLTGLMPSEHGLHMNAFGERQLPVPVDLRAPSTLAELAHARGYRTAAVVANGMLMLGRGLERGFEVWRKPGVPIPYPGAGGVIVTRVARDRFAHEFAPYPRAARVNRDVLAVLERCHAAPCFVLANYMDAHAPYLAPPQFRGRFWSGAAPAGAGPIARISDPPLLREYARARYDEAVVSLDSEVVRLLREIEARDLLDDAWLVVTSDHGEGFGPDHPTEHGTSLYNDQVRIPLFIVAPRGHKPIEFAGPVSLRDVSATVAQILGAPKFGGGSSLLSPLSADHAVQLEFSGDRRPHRLKTCGESAGDPARGVVQGGRKLLEQAGRLDVFDLARDPHERAPAIVGREAGGLAALLPRGIKAVGTPASSLSEQQRRELEALGYLDASP